MRKFLLFAAFSVLFIGSTSAPAQNLTKPDNNRLLTLQGGEDCASAAIISVPDTVSGTTSGYADDYDYACPYSATAPDVVYSYTPVTDEMVVISLCNPGTNYDTKLYVYKDVCGVDDSVVACNDDFCDLLSELSDVELDSGSTYYIVVDGYASQSGDYELTVSYVSTCYEYLPGDINMYSGTWPPAILASDVTYFVTYFRGIHEACLLDGFWASADVNGDCFVNLLDCTYLVNYFKHSFDIHYCSLYVPCWLTYEDLPDDPPAGWPNCESMPLIEREITGNIAEKSGRDAEVTFWIGNTDGSPVPMRLGHKASVDLYIKTSDSAACLHLPLGTNNEHIDSLLSYEHNIFFHPLDTWAVAGFLDPDGSPPNPAGWSNQSFVGIARFPATFAPFIHFASPTKILSFVVQAVDNPLLWGDTVECFNLGLNPRNGSALIGDTLGLRAFTTEANFSPVCFCYPYLPGDVNMYNGIWEPAIIGSDATYLINYFLGRSTSHPCVFDSLWAAADINGDCRIIGSDVTKLINYLIGSGSISHCPDYPPCYPPIPPNPPLEWPGCD
jgi:hypothetical protein